MSTPVPVPAAPSPLSRRLLVGIPAVAVVLSGLAVHALLVWTSLDRWRWGDAAFSLANATVYVAVMWTAAVLTFQWTTVRWPLRSLPDVAAHVAAQVATTVLSFVVGSAAVRLILGGIYPPSVFAVIAAVAAVSMAGLATVLYGALAYQRLREAEAAALRAELRALRAQINPHFLFNALNAIAALARSRPAEAERVTEHLADLFRYSLAASDRPRVSLGEEVGSAETFLAIEQARYGDALTVRVDVPAELRGAQVPSLTVQPLVENAVKHGLRRTGGAGTVTIRARRDGAALVVSVLDTGPGFGTDDVADVLGRGTGLTNVAERLRADLGPEAGLRLVPGGIALRVPVAPPDA